MKKDIGIYVPSYNRWDAINTIKCVPNATYVVRQSQQDKYKEAGIKNIWAVEDNLINSWCNVMNYIKDNAPETLITIMDDDILNFFYVSDDIVNITDPEITEMELARILTIMHDLEIGFGALMFDYDPKKYSQEFKFAGTLGAVYFFNRDKVKGKFHNEASAVADAEFELQELLINRIVLLPKYIVPMALYNKGKNTQNRSLKVQHESCVWTKLKWGKYFDYNLRTRKTKIKVKR